MPQDGGVETWPRERKTPQEPDGDYASPPVPCNTSLSRTFAISRTSTKRCPMICQKSSFIIPLRRSWSSS